MPKAHAPLHTSERDHVICFDLQGPFPPSKHGGNRYVVNFYVLSDKNGKKQREWHLYFLQSKDQVVDHLDHFLDIGDWRGYQLFTDNEYVLNSAKMRNIVRNHRMKPFRNSCEYEPWQNPAERPWRTLAASAREFSLRGLGGDDSYWTYANMQRKQIHDAMHQSDGTGRIAHLRVPFCLAYAKTPV